MEHGRNSKFKHGNKKLDLKEDKPQQPAENIVYTILS